MFLFIAKFQKVLRSYVSSYFTIVIILKKKKEATTKVRYHPTFVQTTRARLIKPVNHLHKKVFKTFPAAPFNHHFGS